jgi:hypothetical protein
VSARNVSYKLWHIKSFKESAEKVYAFQIMTDEVKKNDSQWFDTRHLFTNPLQFCFIICHYEPSRRLKGTGPI